ncbi:MAG: hypothetical protein K5864_01995 [Bacteroidales bacterium]|nr:hypothetical protein [Bacteroidales bacterium]
MKKVFSILMVVFAMTAMVACTEKENNGSSTADGWVDLGLPSGLLWATYNVGASAPEQSGEVFAWGETQPKIEYSWSTYQYCNGGDAYQLTKYCTDTNYGYNGYTDNLTTLEPGDDAATAYLGNGARTPTYFEWRELLANTTVVATSQNGVEGRKFTAANGNSIFLPFGYYWSASLYTDYPLWAWNLFVESRFQELSINEGERYHAFYVRAVKNAN